MNAPGSPHVYRAINAVQADLSVAGISKDRTNQFDKYQFRGIDDVYNALAPLLAKHGLCILPRILKREVVERESQKGGALFYITVEAEFDFVSAEDGSKHVVRTFGEAMDRGDKGTNKAMSAAYKYAAFQAFSIPTEGDNDADSASHAVKPAVGVISGPAEAYKALSAEWQQWVDDVATRAENTAATSVSEAINVIDSALDSEQLDDPGYKIAIWSKLGSRTRAAIKAHTAAKAV